MSRSWITGALSVSVLAVTLLATLGPAGQAVADAFSFLWPVGVVAALAILCLVLGGLLWRARPSREKERRARRARWDEPASRPGSPLAGSSTRRQDERNDAYNAVLSTSEAYINAHRGLEGMAEQPDVYMPELEDAEASVNLANQNFVGARQRVEQHGVKLVLDATLAIEQAVNKGRYDEAAHIRRDQLVPAVRHEMDDGRVAGGLGPTDSQTSDQTSNANLKQGLQDQLRRGKRIRLNASVTAEGSSGAIEIWEQDVATVLEDAGRYDLLARFEDRTTGDRVRALVSGPWSTHGRMDRRLQSLSRFIGELPD